MDVKTLNLTQTVMNFSELLAFLDTKITFCLKDWHCYDCVLALGHYSLEEVSLEKLFLKNVAALGVMFL